MKAFQLKFTGKILLCHHCSVYISHVYKSTSQIPDENEVAANKTIINIGWTLTLELLQKQNGRSNGYIKHLWRLIYSLLTIAMLVGTLMVIKDTGKVQNRRVAKLWIVLIPILIIILILVKKFFPQQLIHDCRYCSTNNTKEVHLLVSSAFCVKIRIDGRTNQFEKKTLYLVSN